MAKFLIDWLERKTIPALNKDKYNVVLIGPNNEKEMGVTIWADYPHFEELAPGREVEGFIKETEKNGYKNKTLYPLNDLPPAPVKPEMNGQEKKVRLRMLLQEALDLLG